MNLNRWDSGVPGGRGGDLRGRHSSVPASSGDGQLLKRLDEQNDEIMRICQETEIAWAYYPGQFGCDL
jgi:hypothetical protein